MTPFEFYRQIGLLVGLPVAILAGAGAVLIVIPRDWRAVLFGYALMSVMLSLLLARVVPGEWALMQIIVGGLIAVMIYLSAGQLRSISRSRVQWPSRWPVMASLTSFRLIAVLLTALAYTFLRERVTLPEVTPLFQDTIVWLAMMGILGLALHTEPMHAGLSLLTLIGGFELLLFTLQQDRLLVGLIMGWQLLLGLAIAYLVLSHGLAPTVGAALASTDTTDTAL